MIRVLIVDDDKLVRKGLISSMPWEEFGMEIAGEANNGENALKFMENHEIDLLLTDLSMPVMSGIELMRIVRKRYEHVPIVVLSLHQDFEYVQEALRLGAIDYIAKIQLEEEQFEEVLGRIVRLMEQKEGGRRKAIQPDAGGLQGDEIYAYYAMHVNVEETRTGQSLQGLLMEAEPGIWYGAEPLPADHPVVSTLACVRFVNLGKKDRRSLLGLLRAYGKKELFYDYEPEQGCRELLASEVLKCAGDKSGDIVGMDELKTRWGAADWMQDDELYARQLAELKALRLPSVRLARIFYSLSDEWNRLYQAILAEPIRIEDFFPSWHRFEQWLNEVRERISQAGAKQQFSPEIQSSILKAVGLAQQYLGEGISSSEMAHRVNMSGSYFSQCFKQYMGQTYTDYMRDIRMERAKEYLRGTSKTIQWIAEQIGYTDEKYFSRLFREHSGILPSEYRQQGK
ncbi:response regulator [Paenibacillus sp. HB172176]|uniref:response regulator n=1 Tax=Paenibacillus sp. HB172176 TaxID=2493690 RepID=UPI00143B8813|nr:response regulator [Paenibacillus sp. HB172176]